MSPTLAKSLTALIVAALGIAQNFGVPGLGELNLGEVGDWLVTTLATLLAGGVWIRGHWLMGDKAPTQPVDGVDAFIRSGKFE